ncbi:VIT domain-containing protein [Actinophytocola oryzae]|uniref:Ca-activated chloride channel family protein n=1 Tax=Actinophytocola oryzae TaxID=502181 RepID=A0A4R7VNQ8_9PSEU|nr:VIT domain-containing protein [Actinophytocola oryzae]TDV50978.1 Ca-activated chloride channel family protein [Actinophytocola oryzae]
MSTDIELIDQAEVTARPTDDDGLGCLRTKRGNLPLESIDVRTRITGLASQTEVTQGFRNTHDEPLEATYVFPLPPRAAVTAMRMEADGRVVEGLLKERGQARADYDQAIQEGKRASIAEEERPGVFTMRVGNIVPGERVTVHLTLAGALSYEDGEATFRFPLVVAPRYIPGTPLEGAQVGDGTAEDTDAVPDASRISPPVLLPGFPNPVALSLEVEVDTAGLPLAGVRSSLHTVATEDTPNGMRIRLDPGERADRDFLLRLRLGDEDAVTTSLAVLPDDEGGTFALTVLPPANELVGRARDVVLVLDRSGSMGGWKMVAARRAASRIVDTLRGDDRFAVLAFDYQTDTPPGLPDGLVEATDRNRFRAVEFLATLDARGGTEMLSPLRRATNLLREAADRERVLVLVTDGQIGNEDQILSELAPTLAGVRVHTVGIDRAVNEGFLQRLAGSQGRCELVESEDRLDEAMHNIHRRIGTPLVTELCVTQDGLAVDPATLAPAPVPDLYPGAPVVVLGRFTGTAEGAVVVSGMPNWRTEVTAARSTNPALAALWARASIRDLEDRYVTGQKTLEHQIVETSLKFNVLSRFTAFVAVDQRVVNEGGKTRRVTQPVDLPSGWEVPVTAAPAATAPAAAMRTFGAMSRFSGESAGGSAHGARFSKQGGAPAGAPQPTPQPGSVPRPAGGYGTPGDSYGTPGSGPGGNYGIPGGGQDVPGGGQDIPGGYGTPGGGFGTPGDSFPTPGGPNAPWTPPTVPPRSRKPGRPVPPVPSPSDAKSLKNFVTGELTRLTGNDGQDVWLRAGLLTALSERIRLQLPTWQQTTEPEEARNTLEALSTELAAPTADPAEVDRRWQKTIATLTSLADDGGTARPRQPFWKR